MIVLINRAPLFQALAGNEVLARDCGEMAFEVFPTHSIFGWIGNNECIGANRNLMLSRVRSQTYMIGFGCILHFKLAGYEVIMAVAHVDCKNSNPALHA